ncbi:Protein prune 2 [Halocaridina rubra]|uniref:Protein prune 2 n=1 Tax=Halocaridina rubra TaxID=373956 RepID=A0AAN8XL11_HALRR
MRGESGEAIVGSGSVVAGDDIIGTMRDGRGVKSPASPPLSAAPSQVSLAPSDLTTSDPDIAGSSAYSSAPSSRPPSSSQMSLATSDLTNSELDLALTNSVPSSASSSRPPSSSEIMTTELVLPAPEDYKAETVEFPTSPMALKSESGRESGVCFMEVDDTTGGSRPVTPNMFLTPNYKPDEVENSGTSPKQADGFEVGSDLEEDYFEEFHLPNSHENAFVRHKSFRRKVHLTPIDAPDAEKIEGLVRTGEFQRHNSIRRKITEDPSASPEGVTVNGNLDFDSNENIRDSGGDCILPSEVGTFAKDLKEIENMLNDNGNVDDISDIINDEDSSNHAPGNFESSDFSIMRNHSPHHASIGLSSTSTPLSRHTKTPTNYATLELSMTTEESITDESTEESLTIEQSTLMKVRECLDFTKYKDLYNLSGRLQDILTPKEVEEILNNSDRYSKYVNKEVIKALHNSLQEQLNNNSSGNIDSGISSPKKMISANGVELGNSVKSDIRAVLDGSAVINNDNEVSNYKRTFEEFDDEDPIDDDGGFRFERRRSLRLSKEGVRELEVEGVFIESKAQDIGLKKIPAPNFDLSSGTNEDFSEIPDLSSEIVNISSADPKTCSAKTNGSPSLPVVLPDIVITNVSDEQEVVEDSSVSKLIIETSDISDMSSHNIDSSADDNDKYQSPKEERPTSLSLGNTQRKRISVAEDILHSPVEDDSISVASASTHRSDGDYDDDIEDDLETPDIHDRCHIYPDMEPVPPPPDELIPEFSAAEESTEERHWRSVVIGGVWRRIDMKVIAPYRKCVTHGGYLGENQHAVIVICACQLPDRSRRDYNYVMDNLFLYVLSTLEQLIADDYILVYLAGGTPKSHMPTFHWLKRAYQMIDRKLRKNLKALHVVHPTFWVRTVVAFSRPFISTKFYRKLTFVNNLTELAQMVPLDQLEIPDAVKQADFELMIREKKKNVDRRRMSSATSR